MIFGKVLIINNHFGKNVCFLFNNVLKVMNRTTKPKK
jgi:hypothetical protein